jgi:hypothetical protein
MGKGKASSSVRRDNGMKVPPIVPAAVIAN